MGKGTKLSAETKQKMSRAHLGKRLSSEHKQKIRETLFGRKGKKHTEETKQKMSRAHLGNTNNLGKKFTREHILAMSKARLGKKRKKFTEAARRNMSKAQLGRKRNKLTEEHRQAISRALLGNTINCGRKLTEEHKQKLREATLKRIENQRCNGQPLKPAIGKNEIQILNNVEQNIGYKIIRQHRVNGYFLDGYCKELNLAIEVDEKWHKKRKEEDTIRENNIKNELNCDFLRLNDIVPKCM